VFKGKKMCGQLGNHRCTIQSLEVVKVDPERHLLHIKGAVPGAPGGHVIIKPAVRKKNKRNKG
jgi:large subunit ribosomal protein L3